MIVDTKGKDSISRERRFFPHCVRVSFAPRVSSVKQYAKIKKSLKCRIEKNSIYLRVKFLVYPYLLNTCFSIYDILLFYK